MTSQKTKDFLMAYDIHEKLNCLGVTENAINLEKVLILLVNYINFNYHHIKYYYIKD